MREWARTWLGGMRLGDAVPQTPWDLSLIGLLPQGEQAGRAWRPTRPPAVCKAPVGARVASQRCPTLRGANGSEFLWRLFPVFPFPFPWGSVERETGNGGGGKACFSS